MFFVMHICCVPDVTVWELLLGVIEITCHSLPCLCIIMCLYLTLTLVHRCQTVLMLFKKIIIISQTLDGIGLGVTVTKETISKTYFLTNALGLLVSPAPLMPGSARLSPVSAVVGHGIQRLTTPHDFPREPPACWNCFCLPRP